MSKRKCAGTSKRANLEELGISRERYLEMRSGCRNGLYDREMLRAACDGGLEFLMKWIILSVTKKLSYDDLEKMWARGEIGRAPCCRTDFYACRRRFYHNLNEILKERGET